MHSSNKPGRCWVGRGWGEWERVMFFCYWREQVPEWINEVSDVLSARGKTVSPFTVSVEHQSDADQQRRATDDLE